MSIIQDDNIYQTLQEYKDFVKYVKEVLDTAYGGVKGWSEADAFEGIYERITKLSD